eukprot:TRINITY_DN20744_c0_g1_i1.p1 TRINITY_DN20744_c0_g1~~TRINITY_DN20744_c0_g1_i1.p1  ORF type:complete len:271 (+),score=47.74 TRINITY_DN20744_c0_g1_i1:3-815(+)
MTIQHLLLACLYLTATTAAYASKHHEYCPHNAGNGTVVFSEDFEEGNLGQWEVQACPNGVSISSDVARTGNHSAKFIVNDGDTHARCSGVPTSNPRAQIVSNDGLFNDGDEFFIAFSVFFPDDFPQPTDWFQIAEIYGPPYEGSPSMGVDICHGDRLCFQRDASHNYDDIWTSSPIEYGEWRDVVLHIKFSTDPSEGFVGVYDNGVKQVMSNGKALVYYQTLSQVNWDGTPNNLYLNQYRASNSPLGTVTIYHDAVKVGTTLDSVTPPPL